MQLYILQFKTDRILKIGISCSPQDRITSLGASRVVDWDNSYVVDSPKEKSIKRLERQLHGDFEEYRQEYQGMKSGNTEIFKSECLDDVLKEIKHKIEFHPGLNLVLKKGIIKPISTPRPKAAKYKKKNDKHDYFFREKFPKTEFYGLRELISAMRKHPDNIKIIYYNRGENKKIDIEFRNFSKVEGLTGLYINFRGSPRVCSVRIIMSTIENEEKDILTASCKDYLSEDSFKHKAYCRFMKILINKAKEIGAGVVYADELSPNKRV